MTIDENPFTTVESYFANAKFYLDSSFIEEAQPTQKEKIGMGQNVDFSNGHSTSLLMTGSSENGVEKSKEKEILQDFTFLIPSLEPSKIFASNGKGFIRPTIGPYVLNGELPSKRANGFDPNAYKLITKAGLEKEKVAELERSIKPPHNEQHVKREGREICKEKL